MRKLVFIYIFHYPLLYGEPYRTAYHYNTNVKFIDFAGYTVHVVFSSLFSHIPVFDHVLPPESPYNGNPRSNPQMIISTLHG